MKTTVLFDFACLLFVLAVTFVCPSRVNGETSLVNSVSDAIVQGEHQNEKIYNAVQGVCFSSMTIHEQAFTVNVASLSDPARPALKHNESTAFTEQSFFFNKNGKRRMDVCFGLNRNELEKEPHVSVESLIRQVAQLNLIRCEDSNTFLYYVAGYDPKLAIPYQEFREKNLATFEKLAGHDAKRFVSLPMDSLFLYLCSSFSYGRFKVSDLSQLAKAEYKTIPWENGSVISCTISFKNSLLSSGMPGNTECRFILDPSRNNSVLFMSGKSTNPDSKTVNYLVMRNRLTRVRDGYLPAETITEYFFVDKIHDGEATGQRSTIQTMTFFYDQKIPSDRLFTLDAFEEYGFRTSILEYKKDGAKMVLSENPEKRNTSSDTLIAEDTDAFQTRKILVLVNIVILLSLLLCWIVRKKNRKGSTQ